MLSGFLLRSFWSLWAHFFNIFRQTISDHVLGRPFSQVTLGSAEDAAAAGGKGGTVSIPV